MITKAAPAAFQPHLEQQAEHCMGSLNDAKFPET